jgi:hypothetical protein
MTNENPYLKIVDRNSDDELFEIIENPEECDNSLLYEAAVSIALKREIITEYQAANLLNGNSSVLEYNPDNLGDQYNALDPVEDIPVYKPKPWGKSGFKGALYFLGMGLLLLSLNYFRSTIDWWGYSFISLGGILTGYLSVLIGLIMLVVAIVKKMKK